MSGGKERSSVNLEEKGPGWLGGGSGRGGGAVQLGSSEGGGESWRRDNAVCSSCDQILKPPLSRVGWSREASPHHTRFALCKAGVKNTVLLFKMQGQNILCIALKWKFYR